MNISESAFDGSFSNGMQLFGKFMQLKSALKYPWLILGVAGIAFSSSVIFFLNPNLPILGSHTFTIKSIPGIAFPEAGKLSAGQAVLGLPVRLKIPKINVDAAVETVGLTPQGDVDVPKSPGNAAWFNLGPRPGSVGSAVIAGHFGPWKNGERSVFDDLNKLKKGDSIAVEDGKGGNVTFVVREFRTYGQNETVPEVFGSSDGKAHLNLITCTGIWNKAQKSYSHRLVVFTDKQYE